MMMPASSSRRTRSAAAGGERPTWRPSALTLLYYTPDVASAGTLLERALLEEIARGSEHVRLEVLAGRWDTAREDAVGIARTPAIVVRGARDYGIRYYGSPDGYELETFLGVTR